MSDVAKGADMGTRKLAPLFTNADRAHLVEEFNWILISSAPGIEGRITKGLHVKNDLYPFEYAKLYGTTQRFLLGCWVKSTDSKQCPSFQSTKTLSSSGARHFLKNRERTLQKIRRCDDLFTEKAFRNKSTTLS
jgi:hypothetical protein